MIIELSQYELDELHMYPVLGLGLRAVVWNAIGRAALEKSGAPTAYKVAEFFRNPDTCSVTVKLELRPELTGPYQNLY